MRDIDHIIRQLKTEIPDTTVTQVRIMYPVDDDGIWFIKIPGRPEEIQIESSKGSCPFLIESDFSTERFQGESIHEVVQIVRGLYEKMRDNA